MISGGGRQSCSILRAILVAHQRPEDIDEPLIHTETQGCAVNPLGCYINIPRICL